MEHDVFTDWYPADILPVRPGIYQRRVDGYVRYVHFNGRAWCRWVETLKTAYILDSSALPLREHEQPDTVSPWRGLKCEIL